MKKTFVFIVLIGFAFHQIQAQITFKPSPESKLIVKGTSTLHDWTSESSTIEGTFIFKSSILDKKLPATGSITDQIKLVVPVTSLTSERGDAMNNKTHNAFGYETNPEIIFEIKSDAITSASKEGTFVLNVSGTLSMAGHTENISFNLTGDRPDKDKLHFTGSYPVDMVIYEMEPPSAMFGQIKTGKDVTIEFDLLLIKK